MLYLLDANTLIDAKRDYYPIDRIPEFWDWIIHMGSQGKIKIPEEVYEEFADKKDKNGNLDSLAEWADRAVVKDSLLLKEEADPDLVARVTYGGYLANPNDEEILKIGRDPFLISYALKEHKQRTIVSTEISKPSKIGANRHVPDVCSGFSVRCIDNFQLIRELNFKTNWNNPP